MGNKEITSLLRDLDAQGFTTKRTKRGHYQVTKDSVYVTTLPGTPSDWRALANAIAAARRAGFVHKGR
jgi:predicted RNA binding protein YcfA (HicA-like mRNA interferase family)